MYISELNVIFSCNKNSCRFVALWLKKTICYGLILHAQSILQQNQNIEGYLYILSLI